MVMTDVKKLQETKKSFEKIKKATAAQKYDYCIEQIGTLVDVIGQMAETLGYQDPISIDKESTKKVKSVKEEKASFSVADVKKVLKEELESWGLNVDYCGCRLLFELISVVKKKGITKQSSYEEICAAINPKDPNFVKRNVTTIRKKANFSNPKYFSILKRMQKDNITNEIIMKQIIDLCQ